jgi:FkbM family methyltransferase
MTIRQHIKYWLHNSCPGIKGSFPYFGTKLHFPPDSLSFKAVCQQGIYESTNVQMLKALALPGTTVFDVGANIGLMAAPLLHHLPSIQIVSFEPSPNTLPYLRQSRDESIHAARWKIIEKAVGAEAGEVTFNLSNPSDSLFDGVLPTGRVPSSGTVKVELTTIDHVWNELGKPNVSVIKCDIEGGESAMLQGADQCIAACRPALLLEWNPDNLAAYGILPGHLISYAHSHGYNVYSVPSLVRIETLSELKVHMAFSENFMLQAREQ